MGDIKAHRLSILLGWLIAATTVGCPLGKGSKQLGEECQFMNDCASLICTSDHAPNHPPPTKSGPFYCSATCKSDADCGGAKVKMVCKADAAGTTHRCEAP